jgi:hypothetical protein
MYGSSGLSVALVTLSMGLGCAGGDIGEEGACAIDGDCLPGQACSLDGLCFDPDPSLGRLEVTAGELEPPFDPAITFYTLDLGLGVEAIGVVATPRQADLATLTVASAPATPGIASEPIPLALGNNLIEIRVEVGEAVEVYRIAASRAAGIAQQTYGKGSNTQAGDELGAGIALFEDTLAVGAPLEDSGATGVDGDEADDSAPASGAVYVFRRSGTSWVQEAYLKASNTGGSDGLGARLALSGDLLAAAAHGEDSAATGINGDGSNGGAVDSGAVYVFRREGARWSQEAYIKASNTEQADAFGRSLALDGDTLAVGATGEFSGADGVNGDQLDNTAPNAGAVYVFRRQNGIWKQEGYVKASNSATNDIFGRSVAVSGDTLAVGASGEDSADPRIDGDQSDNGATDAGAVYVFVRNGSSWTQQAYLKGSNAEAGDKLGTSVALSGDTLVTGAVGESSSAIGVGGDEADNSAPDAGAAYVFSRREGTWIQEAYVKPSSADPDDSFGASIDLSGDILAVGAFGEDSSATGVASDLGNNSAEDAGAAYVFIRAAEGWLQVAYVKASNTGAGDLFGGIRFEDSIALSGGTLAVGAKHEDSSAAGLDGDEDDEGATNAGAFYVFE